METLGQLLKREREFQGVTLETLSHATKMSHSLLENLEEDRREALPKGAFLKGFIKSYCKNIGLEPEEIFAKYGDLFSEPLKVPEYETFSLKEEKSHLIWIIAVTAMVILIAALIATC